MNLQLIQCKAWLFGLLFVFVFNNPLQCALAQDAKATENLAKIPTEKPKVAPSEPAKTSNVQTDPLRAQITVDEVDKDILVAKNRAIRQAEMRGLWQVLERIDMKNAKEMYASLSADDIHSMVEQLQPMHETITGGRYQADIVMRFDALHIRALKRRYEKTEEPAANSSAATGAGTLLIIPLMQNIKGELSVWQEGNIWRDALNTQALDLGKGKLIMPFGDPTDNLMLDQETVLAGDVKAFQKAATRYGARNAVIALAKIRATNPKMTLFSADIFLRRAGAASEEVTLHYESEAGETIEHLLERAAVDVALKLSKSVNQFSLFEEAEAAKMKGLVMRVEYDTTDKWIRLRKFIEDQPSVNYLDVGAVSPSFAQITIYYKGSPAVIQQALESKGATVKDTGTYWLVTAPARMQRD